MNSIIQAPPTKGSRVNALGLEKSDYRAAPSTLCQGCGHDSIGQRIINVAWELGLDQTQIVKMSGIGCSSKSIAYFMGQSHGFNSVHGRMPAVATGALAANSALTVIGISGDGDTASIGTGQFKHAVRRNVPMVYVVENNGVYGLTKGQFSATADLGQRLKYAGINNLPPLDICMEALVAGATFVARSFAGDPRQVEGLLKAALTHRGIAVIDIISPCVTFNNHDGSTKSYNWGKSQETPLNELNFIAPFEEILVAPYEYEVEVAMHDGSKIVLKKLSPSHDPTNRHLAFAALESAQARMEFITGLIYVSEHERPDLHELLHMCDTPLVHLCEQELKPGKDQFDAVMASF
jgi:2-oxoglutarate ferredoxin oxidoreductase subunit beta